MMNTMKQNTYPLMISVWLFNFFISMICLFLMKKLHAFLFMSLYYLILYMMEWMEDYYEESVSGNYNTFFKTLMKTSFIIFIMSEIMLFFSMFWMFMHSSISPNIEMGCVWPPMNLNYTINPLSLPMVGSLILLSSGVTITMSHHYIMENFFSKAFFMLKYTSMLGLTFVFIQTAEFSSKLYKMSLNLNDSCYSNSFFFITSLHGSHVFGGMLLMMYVNEMSIMNSKKNFCNFEMMSWYWHFVDIVWIFVYSMLYWWNMFLF